MACARKTDGGRGLQVSWLKGSIFEGIRPDHGVAMCTIWGFAMMQPRSALMEDFGLRKESITTLYTRARVALGEWVLSDKGLTTELGKKGTVVVMDETFITKRQPLAQKNSAPMTTRC